MKSVIASNFPPFVNFLNNNRLPSSPSPAKRSRHDSTSENPTNDTKERNLHAGLNLEMLNYPINHFNDIKSKILSNQLSTTSSNTALNNQNNNTQTTPSQPQSVTINDSTISNSTTTATPSNHLPNNNHITVKRITELEFELGHTKIKNKDLTQVVQMLNAKCILAQRALEEKDLIIKQKEKSIEHLNMELERRERILLAYR